LKPPTITKNTLKNLINSTPIINNNKLPHFPTSHSPQNSIPNNNAMIKNTNNHHTTNRNSQKRSNPKNNNNPNKSPTNVREVLSLNTNLTKPFSIKSNNCSHIA
jgi:hypothetical protein